MDKPLELIVVEDNPKHLADARQYFGAPERKDLVKVTYCSTLSEADQKLTADGAQKRYAGVISDVFFPSGYEAERDADGDFVAMVGNGFDGAAQTLRDQLMPHTLSEMNLPKVGSPTGFIVDPCLTEEQIEEYRASAQDKTKHYRGIVEGWAKEERASPYGVFVAMLAKEKGVPVVFNTDVTGHGSDILPVTKWADANGMYAVKTKTDETGGTKDWRMAHLSLVMRIEEQKRGLGPCESKNGGGVVHMKFLDPYQYPKNSNHVGELANPDFRKALLAGYGITG